MQPSPRDDYNEMIAVYNTVMNLKGLLKFPTRAKFSELGGPFSLEQITILSSQESP